MKKTLLLTIATCLALVGFTSCGDNTGFSTVHVLTQDEIDEIAYLDSVKEAQLNQIDADLVLNYAVNITISSSSYDGTDLAINTDTIASVFGMTSSQLLADIADSTITGFAINGSDHSDYSGNSNAGGYWGHWWDADGDVVDWGTTAMIYCDFYTDSGEFYVGQYPGHLTEGQSIKVIECLKYKGTRVAVVIKVTASA